MLYSQAEIIKYHRELKGLTQSQLAEGICSRFHIVKAEAGTRKLSDFVFRDVLAKLGLDPFNFNAGISAEDEDTVFYRQVESSLLNMTAETWLEQSVKAKNEIVNYLNGQKTKPKEAKRWELLLLRAEMSILLPCYSNEFDPETDMPNLAKVREYAIRAIKLFRPDFEIEKIDSYFLTTREYGFITNYALTFGYAGELSKEQAILNKLRANLEKNHKILYGNKALNSIYSALLRNIGENYQLLGMWEECLQHNIENMEIFQKSNDITDYAVSLWNKAYSLMKLERIDEGKDCFKQLFMLLYGLGDRFVHFKISDLKKKYEDAFGGGIDIREDW